MVSDVQLAVVKSYPGRPWRHRVAGMVVLGILFFHVPAVDDAAASSRVTSPKASPSPNPSPSPVPSPSPTKLSVLEGRRLLDEFRKAQRTELLAVEHRQKFELKELRASQKARLKEWELREREARHQFFREHSKGAERREYIQDFLNRRKVLVQGMKEELEQRHREHEAKIKELKEGQLTRIKEANAAIAEGTRPSSQLWPQAGG